MDQIKSIENKFRCPIITVGFLALILSVVGSITESFSRPVNLVLFIVALVIIVPYWLFLVYIFFKACWSSEEPYTRKVAPTNSDSDPRDEVKLNFKNLRY